MPFTPNFDQPGNTEAEDALIAKKAIARQNTANGLVVLIDEKLTRNKNEDARKYHVGLPSVYDAQVKEMVRAVYIGVGWSDVKFNETDHGAREAYILTTITLIK